MTAKVLLTSLMLALLCQESFGNTIDTSTKIGKVTLMVVIGLCLLGVAFFIMIFSGCYYYKNRTRGNMKTNLEY